MEQILLTPEKLKDLVSAEGYCVGPVGAQNIAKAQLAEVLKRIEEDTNNFEVSLSLGFIEQLRKDAT